MCRPSSSVAQGWFQTRYQICSDQHRVLGICCSRPQQPAIGCAEWYDEGKRKKKRTMSPKPPAPWMTSEFFLSKRRRCYLDRVWRKSRSNLGRSRYSKQYHCNTQMAKAKSDYYTNMVSNNAEDPRQLWNCINKI